MRKSIALIILTFGVVMLHAQITWLNPRPLGNNFGSIVTAPDSIVVDRPIWSCTVHTGQVYLYVREVCNCALSISKKEILKYFFSYPSISKKKSVFSLTISKEAQYKHI
jgi:hypothetical protein